METSDRTPNAGITSRNLMIFCSAVLASGWLGHLLNLLTGSPEPESVGMLLWILTPLCVSLLLRGVAGDGWTDLGIRPGFRKNASWYILSLFIFPLIIAAALTIGWALSLASFQEFPSGGPSSLMKPFVFALLPMFFKNILEEFAWRGYLAPKVYSMGFDNFIGHSVVGFIWGTWHIPYYLYFLNSATIRSYTSLNLPAFIILAVAAMIAWASVFGEIRLLTGSVWPAVLMHMIEDAALGQFLLGHVLSIRRGADWLVSPVFGIFSIIIFFAAGIVLNRYRRTHRF